MELKFIIDENDRDKKIIDYLRENAGISSRLLRKLKKEKKITVNSHIISLNALLRKGDVILVDMPDEENIFEAENIDIEVVYEDDHMMLINKQPYLVVHPTKGHPYGTIANGLANYIEKKGESYKIRFANRLDRDTSGLMIICKNGYSQKLISDQMNLNEIQKKYYAIVDGVIEDDSGTINLPIGLKNENDVARKVFDEGSPSVTHYKVIERFKNSTLVEVLLETGRTHQIRVHFKAIGHVLLGDKLYGGNHELINRQALHAFSLVLKDISGVEVVYSIELPIDMQDLIKELRG